MDPRRIRIIEKLSPPSNRKGLQRLLGLFVYWRRYIKQFSSHTYHMRQGMMLNFAGIRNVTENFNIF